VLSTLEKLSKGTAALDKAYSDAIERIDGQLAEDRSLARRTISWISYAQRPLTTQELCHAQATMPGDRALNNDNFYDVEDIISVCAGLVTIDEESNFIRLVHYTTQEYFEHIRLEWNPSALEEIASICLTYLSFDTFRSGSCRSDEDFEGRLRKSIFLDYAARHWAEHIRPVEATVAELALAFLQDDGLVSCSTQIISMKGYKFPGYSQIFPQVTTGLHLSARFGLVLLSEMLLTVDCKDSLTDANAKASSGQTPLSIAAQYGREAVVKLLLKTSQVEVDLKDKLGRTPLWWAARYGHKAVVKLLLETSQVDVNLKNQRGRTALWGAANNGHEAIVELLLKTSQVDVNSKDDRGRTPLLIATVNRHEAVAKLLLETSQVDVDLKDDRDWTPLLIATNNGSKAIVKLLHKYIN
jgi:hypothetical protein